MEKDILTEARDAFRLCVDSDREQRDREIDDMRFTWLDEHWPESIVRQREEEGRPCLTIPRLPSFVRQVVNDSRMNKPAVRVHPVDSFADVDTARVLDGLIRNIEYISNADVAYDTAIEHSATIGRGYWRIVTDYAHDDTFDMDILIRRIANPFTVYGDPYSEAADSSDWNVCFVTELLTKDYFERKYPNADMASFETDSDMDDALWSSGEQIRVAEYWTREEVERTLYKLSDGSVIGEEMMGRVIMDGLTYADLIAGGVVEISGQRVTRSHKVRQRIITRHEVLEDNEWPGRYIPIVPVYGEEVNVEGERHFFGLIHRAKDAQRNFNYWRSAATELVALAPRTPFIGPSEAFTADTGKWETANSSSHAYIAYAGQVRPTREPFAGVPAGALQEALNASDDMKDIMGIHDASLGARSNETSGRAIMARQREGDVSTFHFIDNLSRAIRHTGRILIDLIPHVYNEARVIRVLGEDGTPDPVPVNQPVQDSEGRETIYDLTNGKYDVTVKSGPSFTTRREEAAYQMTEMVRGNPELITIAGDIIARNLDWPGAEELAERLKVMNPAVEKLKAQQQAEQMQAQGMEPPPPPEVQAQQAELAMKRQEAEMQLQMKREEKMAEMELKREEAANDMQIEQMKLDREMELKRMRIEMEMRLEQQKAQGRLAVEQYKAINDEMRNP